MQHAKQVIMGMVGAAAFFAFTPLKFILMAITCYVFMMSFKLDKPATSDQSNRNRRLREWWDSIRLKCDTDDCRLMGMDVAL